MMGKEIEVAKIYRHLDLDYAGDRTLYPIREKTDAGIGVNTRKMIGRVLITLLVIVATIVAPTMLSREASNESPFHEEKQSSIEHPFLMVDGPLDTKVELLNADVTEGYASTEELEASIEDAAKFLVNVVYNRNVKDTAKVQNFKLRYVKLRSVVGKNNNEKLDVEESDTVVCDSKYVYFSEGNSISVWNILRGELVKRVEMPAIDTKNLGSNLGTDDYYPNPQPQIKALLLHERRLLVIVDGYGLELQRRDDAGDGHVLLDYLATHLRLYDTQLLLARDPNSDGLLGTVDINGSYGTIHAINGSVHVVTTTELNTTKDLVEPFESTGKLNSSMLKSAYSRLVEQIASSKAAAFKDKLMNDLRRGDSDGSIPFLARINLWRKTTSRRAAEEDLYDEGLLNSLILISSMDIMQTTAEGTLQIGSSSGAFTPTRWRNFYADTNRIIVTCSVPDYDDETFIMNNSTALLTFELIGAASKPQSVGKINGTILNSRSIDVVGDVLRVAVTSQDAGTEEGEEWAAEQNSATMMYVLILDISNPDTSRMNLLKSYRRENAREYDEPDQMNELGRVRVGKPNERFTAVKFFNDKAIASTVKAIDPYYVLDLSEDANPKAVGELPIRGFPYYFFSINKEGSLILSVDRSPSDRKYLRLTLFDIRDLSNPSVLHTHLITTSNNFDWDGLWRQASTGNKAKVKFHDGRLLIPIEIWDETNDNIKVTSGCFEYSVNESGIEEIGYCGLGVSYDLRQ